MKRITLFCGHYGSGKSNIAVNYALSLKDKGLPVALADIDIVNPYFRSADSREELESAGVKVITLPFANSNVDLPAIPSEVYGLVQNKNTYAVMDIGGDDRGALALGRFTPYIKEENDYEMIFVVNFYRPLTQAAIDAFSVMKEIEAAANLRFTGIVNNSNLGEETTFSDLLRSVDLAEELSRLSSLPVLFTVMDERIKEEEKIENLIKIKLQKKIF